MIKENQRERVIFRTRGVQGHPLLDMISREGQQQPRPLLDFLQSRGLIQSTSTPQASAPQVAKTPVLDIWRAGYRPIRQLVASTALGISYVDEVKLKREEGAKALGENFTPEEIEKLKMAENEALKKIEMERKKKNIERIQGETDFSPILNG